MGIVIKAENIGKKYIIGHQRCEQYTTLRDTIMHKMRSAGQRILYSCLPHRETAGREEIWALRDINFEVEQGDRVGIIGRNGAGKSTLLKILSRITEPATGRITIRGRIASLLEVGTGFHPELTGRENIFLNGAILGMTKAEIKRKFDEIVAFAEIEKFLDTPVKRYSSGMYVRLAFAVAAHLEPEILLVDEVLAVGDIAFQQKCIGKMGDVAREGRTVLFVSHNMGAIQQLTNRCIVLNQGNISFIGDVTQGVEEYMALCKIDHQFIHHNLHTEVEGFFVKSFSFDKDKHEKGFNKPFLLVLDLEIEKSFSGVSFRFGIINSLGSRIITAEKTIHTLPKGRHKIEFNISDHRLPPGSYTITIAILSHSVRFVHKENIISFAISEEKIADPFLVKKRDRLGVFLQPECKISKVD